MTTRNQQSLIDIALQEYGSVAGLVDLALRNGKSITDLLLVGEALTVGEVLEKDVVSFYQSKNIKVATGAETFIPPVGVAYQVGNGLFFDGVNDYVQLENSFLTLLENNVQANKDFSIAIWLKIESSFAGTYGQGATLVAINNNSFNGTTRGATIGSFGANNLQCYILNAGSSNLVGVDVTKSLATGIHHFVFTHKANTNTKAYIDGVLEATRADVSVSDISYSGINARIGGYFGNSLFAQKGGIFDLKIFNACLTTEEIALLYGSVLPNSVASNLIFNMPFEILQKPISDVTTPELISASKGTLFGYSTGAKGIINQAGTDIQLVP